MTHDEQNPHGEGDIIIFQPSEIFGIYSDFLARQGGKVVSVRGIFKQGAGKSYGGYFYDIICDQYSGQELSIKIPGLLETTSPTATSWILPEL